MHVSSLREILEMNGMLVINQWLLECDITSICANLVSYVCFVSFSFFTYVRCNSATCAVTLAALPRIHLNDR